MAGELFTPTIDEQLAEAVREAGMRRKVYPPLINSGKMSRTKAERQIALMDAIADTLKTVRDSGQT